MLAPVHPIDDNGHGDLGRDALESLQVQLGPQFVLHQRSRILQREQAGEVCLLHFGQENGP